MLPSVSAGIFTIDDTKTSLSIKTIDEKGIASKDAIAEKDLKTDVIQSIKIELANGAKIPETKTVQMYPESYFLILDDFAGTASIMQTSTKEGYPLIEVYYGYQKSRFEPWQYYFRIEQIDKDNAYVIYANFGKKLVWLNAIPRSTYDAIILSGKIPAWESVK